MSDLVAFLTARLDEDEAAAKAVIGAGTGQWQRSTHGDLWDSDDHIVLPDDSLATSAEFAHIARHDPARVLREVEAKRKILADYENGYDEGLTPGLDVAISYLAAVYSDHEDYRQEWA